MDPLDAAPWRADRPWRPAGEPDEHERRARRALAWAVAAAAVLLPWNALAAGRPDLASPGLVAAADLLPVALAVRAAWLRRRWRGRGAARLRLERFPALLGEPLEAVVRLGEPGEAGAIEVTLACRELRPPDGEGGAPWREVEVYRSSQVILPAAETAVTFELPAADRGIGTALGTPDARRWELRLDGRAGSRVSAAFPVPVYAPPVDGPVAG